jgi:hypothetical protein
LPMRAPGVRLRPCGPKVRTLPSRHYIAHETRVECGLSRLRSAVAIQAAFGMGAGQTLHATTIVCSVDSVCTALFRLGFGFPARRYRARLPAQRCGPTPFAPVRRD